MIASAKFRNLIDSTQNLTEKAFHFSNIQIWEIILCRLMITKHIETINLKQEDDEE